MNRIKADVGFKVVIKVRQKCDRELLYSVSLPRREQESEKFNQGGILTVSDHDDKSARRKGTCAESFVSRASLYLNWLLMWVHALRISRSVLLLIKPKALPCLLNT